MQRRALGGRVSTLVGQFRDERVDGRRVLLEQLELVLHCDEGLLELRDFRLLGLQGGGGGGRAARARRKLRFEGAHGGLRGGQFGLERGETLTLRC